MTLPSLSMKLFIEERATEQAERDTLENKEAGVETKESTPPKKEAVRYGNIIDRLDIIY